MFKACRMAVIALVALSPPAHAISLFGLGVITGDPGSIFYDGINANDFDGTLAGELFGVILSGNVSDDPVFDLSITRMNYDTDMNLVSQPVIARASGSQYSFVNNPPAPDSNSFYDFDLASILFEVSFDPEDAFPDYLTGTLFFESQVESVFGPYPQTSGALQIEDAVVPSVPLPASLPMAMAGLAAIGFLRSRKQRT